jgi:hypothetical protein
VIYPDKQPFIDAVQPLHQALKDTPVGALMAKIAALPPVTVTPVTAPPVTAPPVTVPPVTAPAGAVPATQEPSHE